MGPLGDSNKTDKEETRAAQTLSEDQGDRTLPHLSYKASIAVMAKPGKGITRQ